MYNNIIFLTPAIGGLAVWLVVHEALTGSRNHFCTEDGGWSHVPLSVKL